MVAVLVVLTVVVCLLADIYSERKKVRAALGNVPGDRARDGAFFSFPPALERDIPRIPGGLYLDRLHTWAFVEENGTVKVGVDEVVPIVTGNITEFEFQTEGTEVSRGKRFLKILHGRRSVTLKSPVDGTIRAVNYGLAKVWKMCMLIRLTSKRSSSASWSTLPGVPDADRARKSVQKSITFLHPIWMTTQCSIESGNLLPPNIPSSTGSRWTTRRYSSNDNVCIVRCGLRGSVPDESEVQDGGWPRHLARG